MENLTENRFNRVEAVLLMSMACVFGYLIGTKV